MGSPLEECWGDWSDDPRGAHGPLPPSHATTGEGSATVRVGHQATTGADTAYSKRFVPSAASARRAPSLPEGDGASSLWVLVELMEDWKEEQTRTTRMLLTTMVVAYTMLLYRIHVLTKRVSELSR